MKLAGILFALSVFVNTDIFVNGFISNLGGPIRPNGQTSTKGSFAQAFCLVLLFAAVLEAVMQGVI